LRGRGGDLLSIACLLGKLSSEEAVEELERAVRTDSYLHHVSYERYYVLDSEGGRLMEDRAIIEMSRYNDNRGAGRSSGTAFTRRLLPWPTALREP
jgi:hypothetical protein